MSNETNIWLHEGNIYEFDQDYLFSNDNFNWTYGALVDLDGGQDFVFCTFDRQWLYIKEVPASENIGTITPAPVELVDGAAYMFDWIERPMKNSVGVYDLNSQRFYFVSGHILSSYCTNIRLMTVESK